MISVCMATYNGERFIREQLESIVSQLGEQDELIISDDGSSDATLAIAAEFRDRSACRIKIIEGPRRGVIRNFEHSLRCAEGEFIFLCDQDDVWEPDKVARALDVLRDRNISLLVHDAILIDGSGERIMNSFFEFRGSRPGFVKNMVRNSFLGCCMVFRRSILDWVLPFPDRIPMHDWWIGLICELKGNVRFIDDKLMRYRRHNENVTAMHHSPLKEMIRYRWSLSCALLARMLRTVR